MQLLFHVTLDIKSQDEVKYTLTNNETVYLFEEWWFHSGFP